MLYDPRFSMCETSCKHRDVKYSKEMECEFEVGLNVKIKK